MQVHWCKWVCFSMWHQKIYVSNKLVLPYMIKVLKSYKKYTEKAKIIKGMMWGGGNKYFNFSYFEEEINSSRL